MAGVGNFNNTYDQAGYRELYISSKNRSVGINYNGNTIVDSTTNFSITLPNPIAMSNLYVKNVTIPQSFYTFPQPSFTLSSTTSFSITTADSTVITQSLSAGSYNLDLICYIFNQATGMSTENLSFIHGPQPASSVNYYSSFVNPLTASNSDVLVLQDPSGNVVSISAGNLASFNLLMALGLIPQSAPTPGAYPAVYLNNYTSPPLGTRPLYNVKYYSYIGLVPSVDPANNVLTPSSITGYPQAIYFIITMVGGATLTVIMPPGNYNIIGIATALSALAILIANSITVTSSSKTNKITFTGNIASLNSVDPSSMLTLQTLGFAPGYINPYYGPSGGTFNQAIYAAINPSPGSPFTSPNVVNLLGGTCIYISSNALLAYVQVPSTYNTMTNAITNISDILLSVGVSAPVAPLTIAQIPLSNPNAVISWSNPIVTKFVMDNTQPLLALDLIVTFDWLVPVDLNGQDWEITLGYYD